MSVTNDVLRSYLAPWRVVTERLGGPAREDRALAILMSACILVFVAQWPRLAREAHIDEAIQLSHRIGGALLGWVFIAPLFFYGLAAVTAVLLRVAGIRLSGFRSRMALFWALLAASPLWLLWGLVAGLVGPGPGLTAVGVAALAAFLFFWFAGIASAASFGRQSA